MAISWRDEAVHGSSSVNFIEDNCVIKDSIILEDIYIGDNTHIEIALQNVDGSQGKLIS